MYEKANIHGQIKPCRPQRFWVLPEDRKSLDGFKINSEQKITLILGQAAVVEIVGNYENLNTYEGRVQRIC